MNRIGLGSTCLEIFLAILLVTVGVGCGPEAESCQDDNECSEDEQCTESRCEFDLNEENGAENSTANQDNQNGEEVGPVAGEIDGMEFEVVRATVNLIDDTHYVLGLRNYDAGCGGSFDIDDPDNARIINFELVEQEEGTFEVYYASGHGAAFQSGLHSDSEQVDSNAEIEGTYTIDHWTDVPGESIEGEIDFHATEEGVDDHAVGTFEAELCE